MNRKVYGKPFYFILFQPECIRKVPFVLVRLYCCNFQGLASGKGEPL